MTDGRLAAGIAVSVLPDPDDPRAVQAWVQARVDDNPLDLLLDTGSPRSAVPFDGSREARDSTGGSFGTAGERLVERRVTVDRLVVGGLTCTGLEVDQLAEGWPHPPLLGRDVFADGVWSFDFAAGVITPAADVRPEWQEWGSSAPRCLLRWSEVSVHAVWDTGAGVTVVDRTWAEAHPGLVTTELDRDASGTDSSGAAVSGESGVLAPFRVGGITYAEQACAVVDLSQLNARLTTPITIILGLPAIVTTRWIVDFPGGRLAALEGQLDGVRGSGR